MVLVVISAALAGEVYLFAERYLIPHVPLHFADWSRHVLTSEEQHQLSEELRVDLMGVTDASSGAMLSGLIRSISEPKRVCGLEAQRQEGTMARLKRVCCHVLTVRSVRVWRHKQRG